LGSTFILIIFGIVFAYRSYKSRTWKELTRNLYLLWYVYLKNRKYIETRARMKDGGKYFGGVYAWESYEVSKIINY